MKKKRIVIGALLFVFSLVSFAFVFIQRSSAQIEAPKPSKGLSKGDFNTPIVSYEKPTSEESSFRLDRQTKLQNVIKVGVNSINVRINSLNALKKQNNALKTINNNQKVQLNTMIDEQITALNAWSKKMQADTTLEAAKADYRKIFTDFRIYAVFIPKIKLLISLYVEENYLSKYYDVLVPRIQADVAGAAHKCGYVPRQAVLNETRTLAYSALNKINETRAKVNNIVPADYPSTYKAEINFANNDIRTIKTQLEQISKLLKHSYYFNTKNCSFDLDGNGSLSEKDWALFIASWAKTNCKIKNKNNCKCDMNNDGKCDAADWTRFIEDWGKNSVCNKNKVCNIGENYASCPTDCPATIACKADFNKDGKVNSSDQGIFVSDWGRVNCNTPGTQACECDMNKDGKCDGKDWLSFANEYGKNCSSQAACTSTCDPLTYGKRCGGTNDLASTFYMDCVKNNDGCYYTTDHLCPSGQTCQNGVCSTASTACAPIVFSIDGLVCQGGAWQCSAGKVLKPNPWNRSSSTLYDFALDDGFECCAANQCANNGCHENGYYSQDQGGIRCVNGVWEVSCVAKGEIINADNICCGDLSEKTDYYSPTSPNTSKKCCAHNECLRDGQCVANQSTIPGGNVFCDNGLWSNRTSTN
jgi:hypothetical protein